MKKLLTENEMIAIIKAGTISQQTHLHKRQIFQFAFGDDFMDSEDKGDKKTYEDHRSTT